jgi:hypothetical protein
VDGSEAEPAFDPRTGKFFWAKGDQEYLDGLFGAGIAYPKRVTDRVGNVESAVGWFSQVKGHPTWFSQTSQRRLRCQFCLK